MFKRGDKVVFVGKDDKNLKCYDIHIVLHVFRENYIEICDEWEVYPGDLFIPFKKYRRLKLSKINSNITNDRWYQIR